MKTTNTQESMLPVGCLTNDGKLVTHLFPWCAHCKCNHSDKALHIPGPIIDTNKRAFVVMTLGYWGRGKTILEAAKACKQSGAKASDKALCYLVFGDDTPQIDSNGYLLTTGSSESILLFKFIQLGALNRLES